MEQGNCRTSDLNNLMRMITIIPIKEIFSREDDGGKDNQNGCPVCKDKNFDGTSHKCNLCEKYIHPWCGRHPKDEGSGAEITCLNCEK